MEHDPITTEMMLEEEAEEKRLIDTMSLAVFIIIILGVIIIALRPWLQQMRGDEASDEASGDAPDEMDAAFDAPDTAGPPASA